MCRFFWFVWALNTIPPLLAVVATFMPDLARGASTSFFAVIAPLNVLLANSLYDAIDLTNNSDMEDHMQVRSPPAAHDVVVSGSICKHGMPTKNKQAHGAHTATAPGLPRHTPYAPDWDAPGPSTFTCTAPVMGRAKVLLGYHL